MARNEQRQVMLPGELQTARNEPSAARSSSLVSSRIWCDSQTRGYSVFVLELLLLVFSLLTRAAQADSYDSLSNSLWRIRGQRGECVPGNGSASPDCSTKQTVHRPYIDRKWTRRGGQMDKDVPSPRRFLAIDRRPLSSKLFILAFVWFSLLSKQRESVSELPELRLKVMIMVVVTVLVVSTV